MTDTEVNKRLKTLNKIEKILQKENPTGKDVGKLFLLSACEEVKNTLNGCNISPVSSQQLQEKVNTIIATDDLIEVNSYINFMNSLKSSYNLCTAYKVKVKYRLAGYSLIMEKLKHLLECIELSGNAEKYTAELKKELKKLGLLKELEKAVMKDAKYPYLHNIFVQKAITSCNIEELQCFVLDTAEIETEIKKCKSCYNKIIKNIPDMYGTYGTYHKPEMNIKDLTPTPEQEYNIEELVKNVRNYNFYSPVLRHLYYSAETDLNTKGEN